MGQSVFNKTGNTFPRRSYYFVYLLLYLFIYNLCVNEIIAKIWRMQTPRWQTGSRTMRLTLHGQKRRKRRTEKKEEGGQASGESNGYSRINPSIMSSASEFPRCGERLEIIKQSGTPAVVEGGRKGARRVASGWRRVRGEWGPREVSALARVIVRGNKI